MSTHKGTTESHFTTDDGLKSILGLTDIYYVEGPSHRRLSLSAVACTQNFSVLIKNRATTIQLPFLPMPGQSSPENHLHSTKFYQPSPIQTHPLAQTLTQMNNISMTLQDPTDADQCRSVTALPLELIYQRLAYRNFGT